MNGAGRGSKDPRTILLILSHKDYEVNDCYIIYYPVFLCRQDKLDGLADMAKRICIGFDTGVLALRMEV